MDRHIKLNTVGPPVMWGRRTMWVLLLLLVIMVSGWAQAAQTATATKTEQPGGTYTTTSSGCFSISQAQTVQWSATYTGTGGQGDGFYLRDCGQTPYNKYTLSSALTYGYNSGTYYLSPGNYEISIDYYGMGPGSYSITYNRTASIAVTPTSQAFGNVLEGQSATKSFTISSTGDLPVTLGSITSSDPAHFTVQSAPTGQQVPPNRSFSVKFEAGSIPGTTPVTHSATITIQGSSDLGAVTPVVVSVTGTTVPNKPWIELSTSSLSFGTVVAGSSKTQQFAIRNKGAASLSFSITSDNALFTAAPVNGTVSGGSPSNPESKTITVTFAPQASTPAGPQTGTLTITHNDTTQSALTVNLSANVIPNEPRITVSPLSLNFGNVVAGTADSAQLSIQNSGPASLTFSTTSSNTLFSATPSSGTIPGGSTSSPQTLSVTVKFEPPAGTVAGPQTGTLTISHNDPTKPDQLVSLSGAVVEPTRILTVSPSSLDFQEVGIHYNYTQLVTVKNTGNSLLTVTNTTSSQSVFTVNPTAFSVTPSGGERDIEVTFSPVATGSFSGQLSFTSDATNMPVPIVALSGDGITPPPADVYLVLDGSGSMGGQAGGTLTKMDRLHSAAKLFVDLARAGYGDQLGIVRFDYPAVDHLVPLSTFSEYDKTQLKNTIDLIAPGLLTSIGNGIKQAFDVLCDPTVSTAPHRVVLLLSDGMENSPLFLDPANGTPVYTMPTQPDIEVYAVGLGLPENMNPDLLSWLALQRSQTAKGHFNTTKEDWITLHKFFINILSDTFLTQYTVLDPVYHLGTGENVSIPVDIVDSDKGATFAVYWTDPSSQFLVELITPLGNVITPKNASLHGVDYAMADLYTFYRVSFLPPHQWHAEEQSGVWTLVITAIEAPPEKETLSVSVIAPSDLSFQPSVDQGLYTTGEPVHLRAELLERGRPVKDARVTVTVTEPTDGLGNILSQQIDFEPNTPLELEWSKDSMATPKFEKVAMLSQMWPGPLIDYDSRSIRLFDDGLHDDGAAGDGVWANTYTGTTVEGVYTFTFLASGVSRLGEPTTREKTLSTMVEVRDIDLRETDIDVERFFPQMLPGYIGYRVAVVPKDSFGNFVGPGHAWWISIEAPDADYVDELVDNNAGEYSRTIYLPIQADPSGIVFTVNIFDTEVQFSLGEISK